ncbi:MAG: deoxyribonuclease V [Chloroflexi bacterium]|nr:deoxyribonuclease V [Chloroflexota bacterium]
MNFINHNWNISIEKAIEIQQYLSPQIEIGEKINLCEIKTVAGFDVSYKNNYGKAAIVVFSFPEMVLLDQIVVVSPIIFPYIPGLLSFREGPIILAAIEKLKNLPDLLIFDGQGYAHPRRFGLASHMGLYLNRPSIGCAKTRLIGNYNEPGSNVGDYSYLYDSETLEIIGAVVRTKQNVKPLFVSVGYKIDLSDAIKVIIKCIQGYRLPEPIRQADILAASG